MADELKFPLKCKVPGCNQTCASLVIKGDRVWFEWQAEHSRRTHPNEMDAVVLLRLLASQRPGMLKEVLERAA